MKRLFSPILAMLVMVMSMFAAIPAQASPDFGDYFKQKPDVTAYVACRDKLGLDGATGACFDLSMKIANEYFGGDLFKLHAWWVANGDDARRGIVRDFN